MSHIAKLATEARATPTSAADARRGQEGPSKGHKTKEGGMMPILTEPLFCAGPGSKGSEHVESQNVCGCDALQMRKTRQRGLE